MSRTVLVVDDEPDIRLLTKLMLTAGGYRVIEAATGEEALSALTSQPVDLVFLDIRLPGIDGWEVLRRVQESDQLAELPIVMMSAHTSPSTLARARDAGSAGYLVKPFKEEELLEYVEDLAS